VLSDGSALDGRHALVAGGSRGIGRETSLRLACDGVDVAILARDRARAEKVAEEVRALGRRALPLQADLNDFNSVDLAVTTATEAGFPPDILVVTGSAGSPTEIAPFASLHPSTFANYFEGQLFTRLHALSAVLPGMTERGYGKVVFVTTDAGRVPTPGEAMHGAAAAALIFIVRAIAQEVARNGIRVNAVSITVTRDSAAWEDHHAGGLAGPRLTEIFQRVEARAPFGLNEASDVADVVAFLASKETDQITGATISVNGGTSFP
jgi:2-hydroxycyclohexanecarboxyl-CoA dehydrogenase